jgi:hypothetical protein
MPQNPLLFHLETARPMRLKARRGDRGERARHPPPS